MAKFPAITTTQEENLMFNRVSSIADPFQTTAFRFLPVHTR